MSPSGRGLAQPPPQRRGGCAAGETLRQQSHQQHQRQRSRRDGLGPAAYGTALHKAQQHPQQEAGKPPAPRHKARQTQRQQSCCADGRRPYPPALPQHKTRSKARYSPHRQQHPPDAARPHIGRRVPSGLLKAPLTPQVSQPRQSGADVAPQQYARRQQHQQRSAEGSPLPFPIPPQQQSRSKAQRRQSAQPQQARHRFRAQALPQQAPYACQQQHARRRIREAQRPEWGRHRIKLE